MSNRKICIIGGGNIGTAMAAIISRHQSLEVVLCTSQYASFSRDLLLVCPERHQETKVHIDMITHSYEDAVSDADFIAITHPSFLIPDTFKAIAPYIKDNAVVCIVPGNGGAEFFVNLLPPSVRFFGVDRVPCIARSITAGKKVSYYPKPAIRGCALKHQDTQEICNLFAELMDIKCEPLACYLTITLTPGNPLLHPSRLATRFPTWDPTHFEATNFLFYKDWDISASTCLLACDDELCKIVKAYSTLDLQVIPLRQHYESNDALALTHKLASIESLGSIMGPMKQTQFGYQLDLDSRYFLEDIPYGLSIIHGFGQIAGIVMPQIDYLMKWFEEMECTGNANRFANREAIYENNITPQKYKIQTLEDVIRLYTG